MSMFSLGTGVVWLSSLGLHHILLNLAKEFVLVLFMMFIYALDENIRIGRVGWHTNVYQPTKAQA